jgi:3-hydroxybutyryl-CoA dehydrogenase
LTLEGLSTVDFVIEAVPEIPDLKTKIFASLAQIAPKHAIGTGFMKWVEMTREEA